jgi:transcriptional regulator with XRE-family HTH domain
MVRLSSLVENFLMEAVAVEHVPFKTRLRQLRTAQRLSQEELSYRTRDLGHPISAQTIRSYEAGRTKPDLSKRSAGRVVYEVLARALEADPEEFAEYRLLIAREALDEGVVGLDAALTTLEQVEAATVEAPGRGRLGDPPPGRIRRLAESQPSGQARAKSQKRRGAAKPRGA